MFRLICASAVVAFSRVSACVGQTGTEKKIRCRPQVQRNTSTNSHRSQPGWLANASSVTAASCLILFCRLLQSGLLTESSMLLKRYIPGGDRGFILLPLNLRKASKLDFCSHVRKSLLVLFKIFHRVFITLVSICHL